MLKKADRQLSKLGHAARKTRGIAPRGLSVLSSCLSTSLQTSASPCYTSLVELGAFAQCYRVAVLLDSPRVLRMVLSVRALRSHHL